jgi:SPP1 gp7 family putative phage head morphogenesis protein
MSTIPPFMPGLPGVTIFNDFSGLYRPTASNADLDRLYSTSVAIYAAANFWGETMSLVQWKLLDANKQPVDPTIPEAQALRHNMPDTLHRSMISEKFRGYNLLYKERNVLNNQVYRLRWMNFNLYQLDEYWQTGLRGFRIMAGGTNYKPIEVDYIQREDGVYWNLVDLQDDFDGVAPAEVAFMYAGVDVEAGTTMLSYFQNMAIPALFIQPHADQKFAPGEREAADLRTLFRKIVRGAMNFGRTIISPARWELQQVQSKMEDLKMGDHIKIARESVRVALDVPKFVVSDEGTSYAEAYESRRQWLNLSFVPRAHKVGSYLQDQLIQPEHPDWTVEPDFSKIPGMKEEAERLTTTVTSQVNSMTRDLYSAQKELGIEPDIILKDIYVVQGVPVPIADIPKFYANMQAQQGLGGAMPPTPGFGGGSPAPISSGNNASGAAPSVPPGAASASKEANTKSAGIMLAIGAVPDLIGLQNQCKVLCQGQQVEWNAPDTFHVTLISLPAIDDAQLALLRGYVASLQINPMDLHIGSLGTFDSLGSYAIRFMIRSNTALEDLQKQCVAFCDQNNIPVSQFSLNYKPHITMGYSNVNPGRLTYSTPLTVQPKGVQLGVDGDIAYERPLNLPAAKSADDHSHDDELWLDDAEFKELRQWRILMARKGIDYEFATNLLPAESVTFGRDLLAQGYGVEQAADAMKAHIVSAKKKSPELSEDEAYAKQESLTFWRDYDNLQADIGHTWLVDYQDKVLATVLDTLDPATLDDTLDAALKAHEADLLDAWIGDVNQPGVLLKLAMAGMAAGQASLERNRVANPHKPVALKASLAIDWTLLSEQALDFLRGYQFDLIKELNHTTREATRQTLTTWMESGESMDALRQALTTLYKDPVRARNIAQSESTIIYNEGAFKRWEDAGVEQARWVTVKGSKVCDVCRRLDGQVADIKTGWRDPVTGKVYRSSAHPGCRCPRKPVID